MGGVAAGLLVIAWIVVAATLALWSLIRHPSPPPLPNLIPPKDLSDEYLYARINVVNQWIRKLAKMRADLAAPYRTQVEAANRYVQECFLELDTRYNVSEKETLVPVVQRALELMRSGLAEEQARAQALVEFQTRHRA